MRLAKVSWGWMSVDQLKTVSPNPDVHVWDALLFARAGGIDPPAGDAIGVAEAKMAKLMLMHVHQSVSRHGSAGVIVVSRFSKSCTRTSGFDAIPCPGCRDGFKRMIDR